jgi:hypothetical protein
MTQNLPPEHPDPRLQRAKWQSLNGPWHFAFDPGLIGEQEHWYLRNSRGTVAPAIGRHQSEGGKLTINVPFPWESPLSGVARPDYKGAGWYERDFTVPADWAGLSPFLNFGAVDWLARVWINGRLVAENENGYLPFSIDLTPHVRPGETATVVVRAFDIAEASTLVGKQVPRWYTHSSGIWQSVWLEGRAPTHVTAIRIEPRVERQDAIVKLKLRAAQAGPCVVRIRSRDGSFATIDTARDLTPGEQQVDLVLPVPQPRLWSPETPHLYEIDVELEPATGGARDSVATYFGMRSVTRAAWNGKDYEYILLNGEPVYLRGALDQAFHPDGLHAYPGDDAIRGDIQLAKDLGLNMLRCHIKLNDPRYYYWADRLGVLMMYDFPSPDLDSPSMRRMFEATLSRALERDFNSPSIFAWVIFNETWGLTKHDTADGQRWVRDMTDLMRRLDPTRLVEDNSPCHYNHVESDINSWHFYINDYHRVRRHVQSVVDRTHPGSSFNYVGANDAGDNFVQSTAPLMNSEYGGIAARHGDQDIAWCFKYQTTELRRHAKICGYVYTELDDIEWEHNGFVNYDRSAKEFGYDEFVEGMTVADLNAADFVGLDAPPCQTLPAGSAFAAPLFVSHWGTPMGASEVRWRLNFIDRFGERRSTAEGTVATTPERFAVTDLGAVRCELPGENGLATLALWLVDETGRIRCRNYVHVEVRGEASPRVECTPHGWALRFAPGDLCETSWPQPFVAPDGGKFSAPGAGWIEYEIALPPEIDMNAVQGARLRFEAAARTATQRIDWPQRVYGFNYPQTEADRKIPSDIAVSITGVKVDEIRLADDPADARGVLSHHHGVDPGAYGFLTEIAIDKTLLEAALEGRAPLRIRFEVSDRNTHPGGFALYGDRLGCIPMAPTLFLLTG